MGGEGKGNKKKNILREGLQSAQGRSWKKKSKESKGIAIVVAAL
jgi:hypothetical protein